MPTTSKRIPRSVSAPVFRKTSRRLVNVLLFKLRDMRIATVGAISCRMRERRRRSAENGTSQQRSGGASPRLSPNEWQFAFDHVISDADGRAQFTKFLQSEYSEENILFWWAVEELKTVCSSECRSEFERTVLEMFETFIASESPLAINIDHDTRTDIIDRVENQDPSSFPDNIYERAQAHVYRLMEKDCFSRFVHTPAYKEVAKKMGLPQTFRFNEKISPC